MATSFVEFGQKVDLTQRIREVLQSYPEGTSVLKELVQNADDAGARQITLLLDQRVFGEVSSLRPEFSKYNGPALLAYNDASFTEADLVSISQVGGSVKRSQLGKTGRFGIGFNSCYHLTDVPTFVTGKLLVAFDPHCSNLGVSARNPGLQVDFVKEQLLARDPALCQPFLCLGCTMRESFPATLFRFPLRTADQAATSRLSKQVYTPEKVLKLLEELQKEAVGLMLFLKSVESIQALTWKPEAAAPETLFVCNVSDPSIKIRNSRALFIKAAQENAKPMEEFYTLSFENRVGEENPKKQSFLVGQALGGGAIADRAVEASANFGVPVTPFAGVAAQLSPSSLLSHLSVFPLAVHELALHTG